MTRSAETLRRFELTVDLYSYPKARFVPKGHVFVPEGLASQVWNDRVVGELNWYYDEKGTVDYLTLLRSQSYDVMREDVRHLHNSWGNIFGEVRRLFSGQGNVPIPMDYIALGVGSAEKELYMLNNIMSYYGDPTRRVDKSNSTEYVPVDISFPLLQNSMRSVFGNETLSDRMESNQLDVKPILADFMNLPEHYLGSKDNMLFVSLGIVWNAEVARIFQTWRELVGRLEKRNKKCLLLVDAEFVGERLDDDLKKSYDNDEAKRFFYHPLELLYQASKDPDATFIVDQKGNREKYADAFSQYGPADGTVQVNVITQANLRKFATDYGFASVTANKYLLGGANLKNSRTVAIFYVPTDYKLGSEDWPSPVLLGYSTRFQYDELLGFLTDPKGLNFTIHGGGVYKNSTDSSSATFGYLLLGVSKAGIPASISSYGSPRAALEAICKNRNLDCSFNEEINGIIFYAILEKKKSAWDIRPTGVPMVLVRAPEKIEGLESLATAVESLWKDSEAINAQEDKVKGCIVWVRPEVYSIRVDSVKTLLDGLFQKYPDQKRTVKVAIVQSQKECELTLADFGF